MKMEGLTEYQCKSQSSLQNNFSIIVREIKHRITFRRQEFINIWIQIYNFFLQKWLLCIHVTMVIFHVIKYSYLDIFLL